MGLAFAEPRLGGHQQGLLVTRGVVVNCSSTDRRNCGQSIFFKQNEGVTDSLFPQSLFPSQFSQSFLPPFFSLVSINVRNSIHP